MVQRPFVEPAEPATPGPPISALLQPGGKLARAETVIKRGIENRLKSLVNLQRGSPTRGYDSALALRFQPRAWSQDACSATSFMSFAFNKHAAAKRLNVA